MSDVTNELVRLAEEDGATFIQAPTGAWYVKDKDGVTIVHGALSKVEAACLYCEDRDLMAATPEAILARIRHEYRPYDTMPAFQEGFDAYQMDGASRRNPYEALWSPQAGVYVQAWDRGANAAMLYARALAFLDKPPADVEKVRPGWLAKLLMGRC